ncbi:siphovirus Gp157 family protein [Vibrio astriarenae]|uniref:siphovirus Gp157 family protein n=1 Tax=Vibrio astriarenae TaxID=1481923 RepID=UPI003736C4B6
MADKPRKMTEIAEEIRLFLKDAKDQGFDDETIANTLEGMGYDIDDKLAAYRLVMDDLENAAKIAKETAKIYSEQAKPYQERSKSLDEQRKAMTWPILNLFKLTGDTKKSGSYGTFYLKTDKPSIHIEEDKIPSEYLTRIVSFKPNKQKIKEALEAGEELDFAWFTEGKESVVLRK